MKPIKLFPIIVVAMMLFVFSQQSSAQLANFYSSPGYSNFIKTTLDNSIWKSSMEKYTKEYTPGSNITKSGSSTSSAPYVIPEYRRYPAVQFKSTGTRLTLQEYLDRVEISQQEKVKLKELILKIFKDYETEAAAKGYHNDWALAYVSYVGLNSHVYYGKKGAPILPFEQNEGLRDVVAEYATDNGLFNNVTDKEKQELYELMIIGGGLTYHYYEKALSENNTEELKNLKLVAAQNLKVLGISVASIESPQAERQIENQVETQTEKFDIASFIPPQGWRRNVANGSLSFMDAKTENGVRSFCQIILYPSGNSSGNGDKDFKAAWKNMVTNGIKSNARPNIQTPNTSDGWAVVTGSANVSFEGMVYKTIVTTISGFGKTMSVQINTAGGDYAATIENFFNDLNLDSKATISNNQTSMNGTISMKDYDFTAPEKWQLQNNNDHIVFINPQSGCTIKVLSPQPSSGNLEQDANAVFDLMYKGWSYQKSGDKKFILAKGFLHKRPEYFMKEAAMSGTNTQGQYILEEGAAMVVKAGNQIVIISARHNSGMLGHDDCYRNYNTWRRFVNNFTIKNIAPAKNNEQESSQRIIGLWKIDATGVVAADYVFAANGNYQSGGGLGSSTTTSDMYYTYIYNRAYPFEGDGSYSISGSLLTLKKRGAVNSEQAIIRFEKVNHGGTGWKDRLYMLKKDSYGDNESLYEKQEK